MTDADREYFVALMAIRSEERAVTDRRLWLDVQSLSPGRGGGPSRCGVALYDGPERFVCLTHRHTGRVWQGRFDSAVLDPAHGATALRYTERNAVRARMVARAEDGEWSSARAHLGLAPTPAWLDTREFEQNWPSPKDWRRSLETLTRREAAALRLATRHDTAFGAPEFVEEISKADSLRRSIRSRSLR